MDLVFSASPCMIGFPFQILFCFASSLSWMELFIKFAFFLFPSKMSHNCCIPWVSACLKLSFCIVLSCFTEGQFGYVQNLGSDFYFPSALCSYCTIIFWHLMLLWKKSKARLNFYFSSIDALFFCALLPEEYFLCIWSSII